MSRADGMPVLPERHITLILHQTAREMDLSLTYRALASGRLIGLREFDRRFDFRTRFVSACGRQNAIFRLSSRLFRAFGCVGTLKEVYEKCDNAIRRKKCEINYEVDGNNTRAESCRRRFYNKRVLKNEKLKIMKTLRNFVL